jgi:hypothetical protein
MLVMKVQAQVRETKKVIRRCDERWKGKNIRAGCDRVRCSIDFLCLAVPQQPIHGQSVPSEEFKPNNALEGSPLE